MEFLELLSPAFFLLAAAGAIIGIVFGAIPGMTATMAVAVCLPLTYTLGLQEGLALLLGLYVGGISGGLVPAILLNIPGTPSSITTTFDGYPMAQRGEAERALKICIVASLVGGVFSALVLFFFAPVLADFAIKFSYVEKFLMIFFALTVIASLSKNIVMGVFSGLLGVLLSLIGSYDVSDGGNGEYRLMLPFMEPYLAFGFSLLPVLIGLFGISTIIEEAEKGAKESSQEDKVNLTKGKPFRFSVFKGQVGNLLRSSSIGTFIGMLPGIGGSAASILAYTQQKNLSKQPHKMGTGEPEGLVASESANNGLTGGALIPLLSLGIPGDSTTAVLIGAFTLQGLQVGPLFIGENIDTWYSMITALMFANVVMFVVMFYAIRYIAKVVLIPKFILYPIIVMMCTVGAYAINYGIMFDVWTLFIFGVAGWIFTKIGIEVAPLVIGFILGGSAEVYFVKSLESYGEYTVLFTKSPIAMVLWGLIVLSIVVSFMIHKKSKQHSGESK
ncbi:MULTISPECIES: tripartite tricarboxylate transporter permease [Marinomonas]|uniref:Tripartite tricarboxylate transporter permease n=1 Tax=Marinomonas arctica TaxID=383750 RepID=A0A7H1J7Q3_9GAMM|nr:MULTISPECIES: tripartite tricarboxylate transporter permease [Marinomonas]MCS7487503.1 membrane protein [Marinomonas sp. BSi20414]QNT06519.1 tripartite tricarboxylate transporter permease [Marinomonas arctica]GGN35661.1 C4-dicarboxylate ABC transporter permease [Marinomonas arctica]